MIAMGQSYLESGGSVLNLSICMNYKTEFLQAKELFDIIGKILYEINVEYEDSL